MTSTTVQGRLRALGRAELTLLLRNRTAVFVALLVPVVMVAAMKSSLESVDLAGTGVSVAGAALSGGVGMVLIQVVYMNLVAAYVARREDLVLKRLRTGEVPDREILTGTALPSVALALAQTALMISVGSAAFGLDGPRRPELLAAGLLLGAVMLTALAAATSVMTRTVQTAQLTTLPLFLVSMVGSGLFVPLKVLPDRTGVGVRTAADDRGDDPRTDRLARRRGERRAAPGRAQRAGLDGARGVCCAAVVPLGTPALRGLCCVGTDAGLAARLAGARQARANFVSTRGSPWR